MLGKTLLNSYVISDLHEDRSFPIVERVNGLNKVKELEYCATIFVADVYDLDDPSVESSNIDCRYLLMVGMATQNPLCSFAEDLEDEGIELASLRAKVEPMMMMKFPIMPDEEDIKSFIDLYLNNVPYRPLERSQKYTPMIR